MTFDWLRFSRSVPTRDARGQHHHQRPPPMATRVHGKRPIPQVVPQVRRVHQRDQHQTSSALVHRAPALKRKAPAVRIPARLAPARPQARSHPPRSHPPQRGSSKLLQCLHIHLHPSHKRDVAPLAPRSSKYMSSQQVPPFPPPRGAVKPPPRRHVHWAPAQAPLPQQPYPYPTHASSGSSRTHSHAAATHYHVPVPIPRYQPPRQSRGPPPSQKRK